MGRTADVCGLYLNAPDSALVLAVDEKTGIGARSRTRLSTLPAPGRPARQEHEYVRHGTANLLVALDVHGGGIYQATGLDRNTATNFIAVLGELDAKVPGELDVHVILDNGSSHVALATRWWFQEHQRFHPHYTPSHASWVEPGGAVLLDPYPAAAQAWGVRLGHRAGRPDHGVHRRLQPTAGPFRWTYDGRPLQAV